MKTKILVQILIVAILGTVTIQAQEKVDFSVKKDLRKVKRDMRKAKKDIKKSMKDVEWDAIHFDGDNFKGIYFDNDMLGDEAIFISEGRLNNLEDVLEDLDVELEELDHLRELIPLEELDVELPELNFAIPDIDIRVPEVYNLRNIYTESGSTLELSKDLEDVSIGKDYYFDVKESCASLDMNIDGTLHSGDLTITVKKPDGEVFQNFQISPLADIDWSQQLKLDDEEGSVYIGKWTISLTGKGASGNYQLRFRAK